MSNSCNKNIANLSLHDNNHDDILTNSSRGLMFINKEQTILSVANDVLATIWLEVPTAYYATICETARIVNILICSLNQKTATTIIYGECDANIFMNESLWEKMHITAYLTSNVGVIFQIYTTATIV